MAIRTAIILVLTGMSLYIFYAAFFQYFIIAIFVITISFITFLVNKGYKTLTSIKTKWKGVTTHEKRRRVHWKES